MRAGSGPRRLRLGVLRRSTMVGLVAGVVFMNLAMVSLWSWRTFASSQGFADTTTDMLKEPAVREVLVAQIVNALEQAGPTSQLTVTARPVIENVVSQLVATDAFEGIFHAGIRELHSGLVEGTRSSLIVRVDDAAELVRASLVAANPTIADAIPDGALTVAVGISQSTPVDTSVRVASLAGWLAAPFAVASLACLVWAVRRAHDRRRALEVIGVTMVVVGVAHFAILSVELQVVASLGDTDRQRTAVRAIFWSTVHLLNVQAKVVMTSGFVLALAAAYAGTGRIRDQIVAVVDRLAAALSRPSWRALACLGLIAAGYFALRWPEASTAIMVRTLAVAAFLAGAVGLLDALGSVGWSEPAPAGFQSGLRRTTTAVGFGVAAVCVTMLFGGLAFARAVRAPDADRRSMEEAGCNGHRELCERTLDEVVFAGTHNSMAASRQQGFFAARQQGGIGAQLASGVRAFLVDLHYGFPSTGGIVRTDFADGRAHRTATEDLLPIERAQVDRIIGQAGAAADDSAVYLCHLFCELGATPAEAAFRLIHDFLRENPNEVVLLVLEDHVTPDDAMRALDRGGLADRAMHWRPGDPLPTLGEMIGEGRNVVVLAENGGGATSWYLDAFEMVQDTPYRFASIDEFSCDHNRGDADSPLLLVNHWLAIDPPDPAAAAEANAMDVLVERARRCGEERQRTPNIVAVDFYGSGDLLAAVDELNGV